MPTSLLLALSCSLLPSIVNGVLTPSQLPHAADKTGVQESPLAALTRSHLLKVKVNGAFKDVRLGDILKEFAAQVQMKTEQSLSWGYAPGFPYGKKLTFTVQERPLELALDELLNAGGEGSGYVVISKQGDKYDGWVRLTTTGERGTEPPPPSAEEEATAMLRLALAKKLVDAGKPRSARPLLELLAKKYAATKAGMEARELLGKLKR